MQHFLRTAKGSVKDDELRDCLRELRFTEECIDDISKVLHNHRDSLTQNYCEVKSLRTPPKRIQWCINLSLIERLVAGCDFEFNAKYSRFVNKRFFQWNPASIPTNYCLSYSVKERRISNVRSTIGHVPSITIHCGLSAERISNSGKTANNS